jgi:hypothetical protein
MEIKEVLTQEHPEVKLAEAQVRKGFVVQDGQEGRHLSACLQSPSCSVH